MLIAVLHLYRVMYMCRACFASSNLTLHVQGHYIFCDEIANCWFYSYRIIYM